MSNSLVPPRWWVAQIGHREQYSIARALLLAKREVCLCTDYWLPGIDENRCHAQISKDKVHNFNVRSVAREALYRLSGKSGWAQIEHRNQWFSEAAAGALSQSSVFPSHVFSYSYAARRIFEVAKAEGARTILGQIDPGIVEHKLVRQLSETWGLPIEDEPSPEHWDQWEQECQLADTIVVNSAWSRRGLLEAGVDANKVTIVPLVEPFERKPFDWASSDRSDSHHLRVLFLGQLSVRKGIMESIAAAHQLRDEPIEWIFVGNGPNEIKQRIKRLGPKVKLIGSVGHLDTPRYFGNADVFLLPTHSDGFAITQLEAIASGLPIIASKNCAPVVTHDKNGILLDSVSVASVTDAVNRLAHDRSLLAHFRENLSEIEVFSLENLSERLIQIEARGARNALSF